MTEANLSWDKAFANLAQTDPRIRGKMALQLQKMRMDEEQARLKAVKESRIGLDYEDIKVTEDGRLIGRRKGTGQYEYMNLPEGARATQPPIMVDTGTGIVPTIRPDALRTTQHLHGLVLVLCLRTFILSLDNNACRYMYDPYGRIGCIDALSACPRRTEGVYPKVFLVYLDIDFFCLRKHGNGCCRGMYPA